MTRVFAAISMAAMLGCPGPPPPDTGALHVTVRDPASGNPLMAVGVTLAGTAIAATTNTSGIAFFSKVDVGPQTVRVQLPGTCVTTRPVMIVTGIVTHVTVWSCDDVVQLQNAPSEPAIALLDVQAQSGATTACLTDELRQGVGVLDLTLNALPLTTCHGSLAVMSRTHALYFSNDAATLTWTAGFGDQLSISLAASTLTVPLQIVIVGENDPAFDRRNALMLDQLKDADDVLGQDFSGLTLTGTPSGGAVGIRRATPAEAAVIGSGCGSVAAIKAQSSLYDQGRLQVFAVAQATDFFGHAVGGTSCLVQGAPEIMFISPEVAKPQALLHEIGHSLGLQRPIWGHTNGLEGFWENSTTEPRNVMDGGRTLSGLYLSVGQVMRMTLAAESWLNLPSAADGSTLRQRQAGGVVPQSIPCGCPETMAMDDCPRLNRDVPRSGLSHGPSTEVVACGVQPILPISLACNAAMPITIAFMPTGAVGSALFVSLTPSIVTVEPGIDDTKNATLTARGNGVGKVRVYADGTPYEIQVTVSGCP